MDKRLVVVVDSWEPDSLHPSGHYVRTLGVIGDKNTETVSQLQRLDAANVLCLFEYGTILFYKGLSQLATAWSVACVLPQRQPHQNPNCPPLPCALPVHGLLNARFFKNRCHDPQLIATCVHTHRR
jgi:hypothetical protein